MQPCPQLCYILFQSCHSMGASCVSLQLGESLSNILPRSCISRCPHVHVHCAPSQHILTYLNISQHISTHLDISQHISTYLKTSQHVSTYLNISQYISNILPRSCISRCPHVRVHSAPLSTSRANSHFYLHHGRCQLRFCLWSVDLNFFRETLVTLFIS